MQDNPQSRPPLRPTAILFALALNILLVTLALFVASSRSLPSGMLSGLPLVGSIIAGVATAVYVGRRAAIHALLGGLLSAPILALFVLPAANWSFAFLAGAFCAVGGIVGEFWQRR